MTARRVTEDHSVADWEKESKRPKLTFQSVARATALHGIIFTPAVLASIFPFEPMGRLFFWTAAIVISTLILVFAHANQSDEIYSHRAARGSIRKARRTASLMDGDHLPALTKEHVEARSRMADAIEQITLYGGVGFTISRTEREDIYLLVFENLIRESLIISLIEDRHMTTAQEIKEALLDMETRPVALWDGSL